VIERNYRTAMYENYVTLQAPEWGRDDAGAASVSCAAALSRLKGWLPADKAARCLDLGCGSGRFLLALRSAGYSDVHGVDLGPQAAELALKAGFQITQSDIREFLRSSTEQFDLITAFDVIEHFGKDELLELFPLIRKRLTANGRFIIQTPNASSPWASSVRYGDLTHELIFSARCLTSVSRLAGFGDVYTREVGPYIHGIPSAIRALGWKLIWSTYAVWNVIETGTTQGGIYTRNLMMLCVNKEPEC
jgi:2-polyprenyl-3-methyl-5-hydroxy-6-metoxy-1,4-benzoquinol methylase